MAVSVGPSSPPFPRNSIISPLSPSRQRNLKLRPWKYVEAKRCILHLHSIQVQVSKPNQIVDGAIKAKPCVSTMRLIPFAASEDQLICDELNSNSLEPENLHSNSLEPENLHLVAEENSARTVSFLPVERTVGKPGFVSFHGLPYQRQDENFGSTPIKETPKIFWFTGPTVLVAFLVFPSLYLRRIFSTVFEDSLLTDFLILFFTEALFYTGVAIFVLLIDYVWRPLQQISPKNYDWSNIQFGSRISSVATLVLSLIIPLVTMGLVWPWTGPAASATLAPYLVGLVVQFAFEQYARHRKSPAWPIIPVIFQVYRLHQLNRAAQLVTALSFSVRGTETTSQTMAINTSLGALLTVLQILGVICIWSLSSFLMRFLPTSQVIPDS